jgi:hypothetical protein
MANSNEKYNVLDLFSGTGGFSASFADSKRWSVTTVELDESFNPDIEADVFDLQPSDFETEYQVVVCSPPCQFLSTAGNHDKWNYETKQPVHDDSRDAVALFHHALGLVRGLSPEYYYIENPRSSRIRWFLGPPKEWVTYCQYGTSYQKPTGLWGNFAPMTFKRCSSGADCHSSNTEDDGTSAVCSMPNDTADRSKVPYELSDAIREACERALDGNAREQSDIREWE